MKTETLENNYSVIIIGTGIGGLTAGAYLTSYGIKVLLCEQHSRPGGYFTSFTRKGYTFDAGIQGCENSGLLIPMLEQLGIKKRIELKKSKVALSLPDFFHSLSEYTDLEFYYDHFKNRFPEESAGLDRVKKEAMKYCRIMDAFMNAPNIMYNSPVKTLTAMPAWFAKYAFKMGGIIKFIRLIKKPVEEYLGEFISDEQLIQLLSVGYRGNPAPFSLTFIYTMMDYYYPAKGGVQAIADLLAEYIIENGGEIRYKTEVDKIIVEKGCASGVLLKNGEKIKSDFVVNNGDIRRTFSEMISPELARGEYGNSVMESRVGESVFSVYLGVDMPAEKIPTQGCPHIFLVPSYKRIKITEMDTNPDFYGNVLLMISVPTLIDPALAPEGKSVIIIQGAASIRSFNNWGTNTGKRTQKYKELKKEVAARFISNVEKIIPGLSKKIEVQVESTPLTFQRYTLNSEGAACGWTYHPDESFRGGLKGITKNTNMGINRLYQVGHWTMSPGGAPAGLVTGKLVSGAIKKRINFGKY